MELIMNSFFLFQSNVFDMHFTYVVAASQTACRPQDASVSCQISVTRPRTGV